MLLTKPAFYDSFACIADKCSDNCCIGWEIDIDEEALSRFEAAEGAFGEKLRAAIKYGGECPTFANTAGQRCALLRQDGLCELVLNMGEDALCDICALHPRFFEWFNDEKEAGLGLCCEEVCRLLFADTEPLLFVAEQIDEETGDDVDGELYRLLKQAREQLFALLSDRSAPLANRLLRCAVYTRRLQQSLDSGEMRLPNAEKASAEISENRRLETVAALLRCLESGEPINDEWTQRICFLSQNAERISAALPEFLQRNSFGLWQYERVAAYSVFRYFLKGSYDGEVLSKLGFSAAFTAALAAMDCMTWLENGRLSERDRINNLKLLSKQTEYSDEVIEEICGAVLSEEMSAERLAECLAY